MPGTDALWGGSIVSVSFDPVAWTLLLVVDVVESGQRSRYQLVLEGVKQWHVSREVPLPWTSAELTEVHVSERGDGVSLELMLWDDNTSLTAHCVRHWVERLL